MKFLQVFTDFAEAMEELNDAERGRLFMAMLKYAESGAEPVFRGNEKVLWPVAKGNIDRQAEAYAHRCEVNRRNITSRYESLPRATNRNESKQDKDKDKDKDKGDSGDKGGNGTDGSGSGDTDRRSTLKSMDDLLSIIGRDLSELNMKELAYTTAALSRFSREGCRAAGTLASRCTEIGRETGNIYFYPKYKDRNPEYISLKTLGEVSGYRYFYDNSRKEATMTKGSTVCIFRAGSDSVRKGGTDGTLKYKTVFSKYPYISEEDSQDVFECSSDYVDATVYAVCLTKDLEKNADDLLKEFEE